MLDLTTKKQYITLFLLTLPFVETASANLDENRPTEKMQVVVNNEVSSLILNARSGDPLAIYNLAHNYHHGTYSAIDLVEAKVWYEKAATTESPAVRYKIARMFEMGIIFEKDLEQAKAHYKFAAEAGDINAQTNLGAIYLSQKGTLEKGIFWSRKAAENSSVQAQVNLAITYQKGLTGKVNKDEAINWFKAAAANGNAFSQHQLGLFYYGVKDYKEAFYWFDLASELKNEDSMLYLSMMFDKGIGVEKSREKSITLLNSAAELGNKKALKMLKQLIKTSEAAQ